MIRIHRIAGEGFDADLVETREFEDPAYPTCPVCETETDDDRGWCSACEAFAHEHPPAVSLEEWVFDQSPDRKWPRIAA